MSSLWDSHRRGFSFLFFATYFAQNSFFSFFNFLNSVYLRTTDVSYTKIGFFSLIALMPMVLKIFIGLTSDILKRRLIFIYIGVALQVIFCFSMTFVDPNGDGYWLYLFCMISCMLGVAFMDTTNDALSIILAEGNQSTQTKMQTIMGVGNALGQIIVVTLLGILQTELGWPSVFVCLSIINLFPIGSFFFLPSDKTITEQTTATQLDTGESTFERMIKAFQRIEFLVAFFYAMSFGMASYGSAGTLFTFINEEVKEHDFSVLEDTILAALMAVGNLCGVFVTRLIAPRLGNRNSGFVSSVYLAVCTLLLISLGSGASVEHVAIVYFFLGTGWGMRTMILNIISMDFADPKLAAFTYSLLMAGANLGISVGDWICGMFVDNFDFRPTFGYIASLNGVSFILVFIMYYLKGRRSVQTTNQEGDTVVVNTDEQNEGEIGTSLFDEEQHQKVKLEDE